jgi:hypothetical protein
MPLGWLGRLIDRIGVVRELRARAARQACPRRMPETLALHTPVMV